MFSASEMHFPTFSPNEDMLRDITRTSRIATPQKVKDVMGELVFPNPTDDKPYLYGCMVLSFDGKMGFYDNEEGHLISKANAFDRIGATTDFWVWNVCRTYADAVILGAGTLTARLHKEWSAKIVDQDLVEARRGLNKRSEQPLSMIATLNGRDIPLAHTILDMRPAPTILTSANGAKYLEDNLNRPCVRVTAPTDFYVDDGKIKIVVAGEDKPDTAGLMKILRQSGIEYMSVEGPGYIWNLIREQMLDEFMLNYSGVMAGGDKFLLGKTAANSVSEHPHVALLSVGFHKGFIYTRQKLLYDCKVKEDMCI